MLESIQSPADLRALSESQLPALAHELRQFLITSVAKTGGHLSSNLGTVELTIALHHVFNTPVDHLIWDVGHQAYGHKVLTGRRESLGTIRQKGGLSGFPARSESEYDIFGTAHSSTALSAAIGLATAAALQGEKRHTVAVVGDGAMTGGMVFEAMNHAGTRRELDLLFVLNDNNMSISRPVGALNRYLAQLLSGRFYRRARETTKNVLAYAPSGLREMAKRFEEHTKGMVVPSTLFEHFGFNYIGPIDGHDLEVLLPTLKNLRESRGLQFLHVITTKGHGYHFAEKDPILYHGPSKFNPSDGIAEKSGEGARTFSRVFSDWLVDMATVDDKLVGITPAMAEGSGLVAFAEKFPSRYFDVGIAEQHATTLAAGFAVGGLKPVLAIYSTFLQRGYDQLIHDVAIQNLDVTLALDRAGIVGADGPTHAGLFDIAYLRCIPNVTLLAPSDEAEARLLLSTAYHHPGPAVVRYPRGSGIGATPATDLAVVPFGKARVLRRVEGERAVALLCFGTLLHPALAAVALLEKEWGEIFSVADMRFIKPLDTVLLDEWRSSHRGFVSIEEGMIAGGAGSAVLEFLEASGSRLPLLQLGWDDVFPEHGTQAEILDEAGLSVVGIADRLRRWLQGVSVVGVT